MLTLDGKMIYCMGSLAALKFFSLQYPISRLPCECIWRLNFEVKPNSFPEYDCYELVLSTLAYRFVTIFSVDPNVLLWEDGITPTAKTSVDNSMCIKCVWYADADDLRRGYTSTNMSCTSCCTWLTPLSTSTTAWPIISHDTTEGRFQAGPTLARRWRITLNCTTHRITSYYLLPSHFI